jgi:hypothetical protein
MKLTLNRFKKILAAYGADPARWPDAEREDAVRFARDNAAARQLLLDAQQLDDALDHMAAPAPGLDAARLAAAVMETPQATPRSGSEPVWAVPWWQWFDWPKLAGLAVMGLLGIAVGWAGIDAQIGVWMGADPVMTELPAALSDPFLGDDWTW